MTWISPPFPVNPALSLNDLLTTSQGRAFTATSGVVTVSGTSETTLLYVKNPSSSPYPWCLFLSKFVNQTAGHTAIFNFYYNPTVSANGTAAPINNLRNNPNTPASSVQVFTAPTASPLGTFVFAVGVGNVEVPSQLPLIVDPGESLLITTTVSNSNDKVLGQLSWFELGL